MQALAESAEEAAVLVRPFLKWVGSKRQLIPEIRRHIPAKFGYYFEPFLGGGAVFFDLHSAGMVTRARLSDLNQELVTTYEGVRDSVDSVVAALRVYATMHSKETYYAVRGHRADGFGQPPSVAARMIYLNRTCYNGLYRVNRSGGFNVPIGRYENPTICDDGNLRACSRALRGIDIECVDFSAATSDARRGDFAYFDPPYVPVSETSDFTQFTSGGFSMADQERLAECARVLKKRGVRVLLSNADLPVVRKLYSDFDVREVSARRNVNSKAGRRGPVGELLIW